MTFAIPFSPDFKFRDHIRDEMSQEEQPKKQILKRDKEGGSLDDVRSESLTNIIQLHIWQGGFCKNNGVYCNQPV